MQRSIWISLGLATTLALWLGSAYLLPDDAGANVDSATGYGADPGANPAGSPGAIGAAAAESSRMRVEVLQSRATSVVREIVLQGQAQAVRSAQIAAETAGRIRRLAVREGQRVASDELLAELYADERPARLAQAEARLRQRRADLAASEKLLRQGLQAETELLARRAEVAAAQADLATIRLDIERTQIRAPFAGVIELSQREEGERVAVGEALFTLVDDSALAINAQLPQRAAAEVQPGMAAQVALISGVELRGEVGFVAAAADPATRSYRIEVDVANPRRLRAAGMSAELRIPVETLSGHFLSPGALALGVGGELGVKRVDAEDRVVFQTVEIVRTESDGAWVTGLPSRARIVTLGQGFVQPGQLVEVVSARQSAVLDAAAGTD